jgi:hypothetical protein
MVLFENEGTLKLLALSLLLLAAIPTFGQTRVLVGVDTGSSFGNLYLGPVVGLEVPVTKHFELDLKDSFSPLEQHIALGSGWANTAKAGGVVWISNSLGVNGSADYSNYHVSISKHAEYAFGGLTYRKSFQYMPVRLSWNYVREFNNGIDVSGTESSRLQAGEFNLDMRMKCAGPMCYRVAFDFMVGHVLTQGNPQCDGTFSSPITCIRRGASAGAFSGSLSMEFPRRRVTEEEAF